MQSHGGEDIDLQPKHFLKFALDARDADERSLVLDGVNQQVKIAFVPVGAMQSGTEDARIARIVALDNAANRYAMKFERIRGFHGVTWQLGVGDL